MMPLVFKFLEYQFRKNLFMAFSESKTRPSEKVLLMTYKSALLYQHKHLLTLINMNLILEMAFVTLLIQEYSLKVGFLFFNL